MVLYAGAGLVPVRTPKGENISPQWAFTHVASRFPFGLRTGTGPALVHNCLWLTSPPSSRFFRLSSLSPLGRA